MGRQMEDDRTVRQVGVQAVSLGDVQLHECTREVPIPGVAINRDTLALRRHKSLDQTLANQAACSGNDTSRRQFSRSSGYRPAGGVVLLIQIQISAVF